MTPLLNPDGTITARMPPDAWLAYAAREVYGAGWTSKLAVALAVNVSTVYRWANGRTPVPQAPLLWLAEQLAKREARRD